MSDFRRRAQTNVEDESSAKEEYGMSRLNAIRQKEGASIAPFLNRILSGNAHGEDWELRLGPLGRYERSALDIVELRS